MADKKEGHDIASYTLGILSIVIALFQPLMGLIIGIVGVYQSQKQKTELSKSGKKLSTIGIILSIILFIAYTLLSLYLIKNGFSNLSALQNFPSS